MLAPLPPSPATDPMRAPPSKDAPPPAGLGLRVQITLALVTGLGLLVVLVGLTADRFAVRAIERERERRAELAASVAAEMIGRADAPSIVVDRAEAALIGTGDVIGLVVDGEDGHAERGVVSGSTTEERPLRGGGMVRVVLAPDEDDAAGALVRALVLYATATALGILILSYALLTRLIVQPIGALRLAADRLARRVPDARAEPVGAAEIAGLATSFNAMARDLKADREALEVQVEELRRTTRELREKEESLLRSEKLASVGRLAAGVAHEIGNPLTSILGLLELVEGGDLTAAEQAEFLRRIHAETDRIHHIIRDLLDFARQDEPARDTGGADVRAAVERAVGLVVPQKDMRRVTLERRVQDELPEVAVSEERLVQVLLNLLMNAADAIDGEGSILVGVDADEEAVTIRVEDSGPGIAPEVADRLFEPFVTTKASGAGTGLGLAVCHAIVDRAGGSIRVERGAGGGACFVVRLPRSPASAAKRHAAAAPA